MGLFKNQIRIELGIIGFKRVGILSRGIQKFHDNAIKNYMLLLSCGLSNVTIDILGALNNLKKVNGKYRKLVTSFIGRALYATVLGASERRPTESGIRLTTIKSLFPTDLYAFSYQGQLRLSYYLSEAGPYVHTLGEPSIAWLANDDSRIPFNIYRGSSELMKRRYVKSSVLSKFNRTQCKLRYAWGNKRFLTTSRSESAVVGENSEIKLLKGDPESIACQAAQADIRNKALALFLSIEKKIKKSSVKMQKRFTYEAILGSITELWYTLQVKIPRCETNNLFNLLSNPCFLLYAYSLVKRIPSGGVDHVPISNVTLASLNSAAYSIANGTYQFKPVRRVFIPKANGKLRPLGIASAIDKVVQKGMLIFLENLFEPGFSKNSYGFRKGKSCHSALDRIYHTWSGTKWFIEADFVGCFDRINHGDLLILLGNKVKEYQFLRLVNKLLKAGYIHFKNLADSDLSSEIGTPQGSLLSPLFCNIFLHELDTFCEQLCGRYTIEPTVGSRRSDEYKESMRWRNSPWTSVLSEIKSLTETRVSSRVITHALRQIRAKDTALKGVKFTVEDDVSRKLLYVRYADDFLLGFKGPKSEGLDILLQISHFAALQLHMDLYPEKTGVRHHEKGVLFLGYKIWYSYGLNPKWRQKVSALGTKYGRRESGARLNFSVPLQRLFARYAERGFFQRAKTGSVKYVGRRVDKWLFLSSDKEILNRFNCVIRGVANYYAGSTQQSVLSRFWAALRKSAALTIAHRNKKASSWWTFKKYGTDITIVYKKGTKDMEMSLFRPKSSKVRWLTGNKGLISNLAVTLAGTSVPITLSVICNVSELECCIPNCPNTAAAWHHIRHRKKLGGPERRKHILAYTAKQIPICKLHHNNIHAGKYDGPSLRKLRGYIPSDFE